MPISKSAIDATRFTSTTPHASAKPPRSTTTSARTSTISQRTSGPSGETPQQKVQRLREAAARARDAKVSGFDKAIMRGRVWADRAHRFTALTLIGITGIAGMVTVYAVGDMIIHNRRKRREYYLEQAALHSAAVHEAQTAFRHGTATDEQISLIKSEEEKRRAEAEREREKEDAKGKSVLAAVKGWLFEGLKRDEDQVRGEGGVADAGEEQGKIGGIETGIYGRIGESAILRAVEEKKAEVIGRIERETERETEREQQGGMLDRLGTGIVAEGADGSKAHANRGDGWTWFSRR